MGSVINFLSPYSSQAPLSLLDKGMENFEGGLSTKKYASMANTSIPTAKRDMTQLIEYKLIKHVESSAGRIHGM
ncbi:MAG: Unknown protein [uncultured Sulfurovum sp.]|uniref:Uncharacterized protein n=1 Tax=uncultured Sulfurovum sp. TaxID=269237 RepID=A0A6S6SEN6_9BACT|nr:MAG: Unknown protein [uncultured Sulfurovum sp.]